MIERHFLAIAVSLSGIALAYPPAFTWARPHIPYLLGLIMFGMGLTLEVKDFVEVWRNRKVVVVGVVAQYTAMPALALLLSYAVGLPEAAIVGMVIVGACPGGTASNVIAYLARANVALSVTMTLASTVLAPILTPTVIYLSVGKIVDVSFWGMVESVFWIVVFPIVDGLIIRRLLQKHTQKLLAVFPSISILTISFVIAIIMGLNQQSVLSFPGLILLAVILHNLLGLSIGYGIGRVFGCSAADCRTLAIEVGMQNSGLGVSLASSFFSSASALPSALFSLWHNLSGIMLAQRWSQPPRDTPLEELGLDHETAI